MFSFGGYHIIKQITSLCVKRTLISVIYEQIN